MLLELAIRDFAIIRELRIPFAPGFNALTGETGAGKSIIIDALGAVLGARVSSDLVRTGASNAWVEALFDVQSLASRDEFRRILSDNGLTIEDGSLILTRDVNANGRSVARVNGRTVTAATLAAIGAFLVDIHGQSEHLSLLRPAVHLDLLDHFAGTSELRQQFSNRALQHDAVARRIAEIHSNERERERRIDMLRYQVDEIGSANLRPGENDELERERAVLANAERLALLAAEAHQLLEAGDDTGVDPVPAALDNVRVAVQRIEELARIDRDNEALANQLREAQFLLEECAISIRSYADGIEANPARLEAVEDRLALLKQLERKYGATIDEVLAYYDRAASELDELEHGEQRAEGLRNELAALRIELGSVGAQLSLRRRVAAPELERQVERAMVDLNMGRAQFEVDFGMQNGSATIPATVDGVEAEFSFDATGIDRVEFLIAPNAGETPKSLARIASGGEMARLMLALKSILSSEDETPTLVFDEVDVGVGGRSAQPVGEKLWGLGERHQVLVISHLAQVAAFAESHCKITKLEQQGRTETRVDRLDDAERLDELAAMLDGHPPTVESRDNARAMLDRIEQWKQEQSAARTVA